MQVVIDSNIIMSILIKPGKPLDLFLCEELEIFTPSLLLDELRNNKVNIYATHELIVLFKGS